MISCLPFTFFLHVCLFWWKMEWGRKKWGGVANCQLPIAQDQDSFLLCFFFFSFLFFSFLVLEHPLLIPLPSFLLLVLSIKRIPIPASDFCLNRFLLIELEINFYGAINLIVLLGRSDCRTIPCYISPHDSLSWIL